MAWNCVRLAANSKSVFAGRNRPDAKGQRRYAADASYDQKKRLRYALGRTNHDPDGGYSTSEFNVNAYFNCVTAVQMSNRRQWIAEIKWHSFTNRPMAISKDMPIKKISPCVNSSAWADNTFSIWIEFQTDTEIMIKQDMETTLTYRPNPTKEDLLEYFSQRIRVRKMTPKEALRLMDFSEESINKIMNAEIRTILKNGMVKVKKMPKTQIYKQAGNSIVCSCIYHIGRTLWMPDQPENQSAKDPLALPLFD